MEVISRSSTSSTLNPNAPMFVPFAYRTVEDFSDEWWDLVHSSPWFRDYWLRECFQDPQYQNEVLDFEFDLDLDRRRRDRRKGGKRGGVSGGAEMAKLWRWLGRSP
ncbi:uncharacterized protein LOC106764141 isoform X2 [Vigna radiata var. radiata]|uniref:Uncharacterized protein LOC106764141 isoform X2 n=1 Tax=Vigna radiata var. radiata TaxID=3916 RepID=A0A3Q0F5I7_VIGRR|nr:uncharacterized protein LOC106764141 isoform X2 [Vigna radiata var. radiata]